MKAIARASRLWLPIWLVAWAVHLIWFTYTYSTNVLYSDQWALYRPIFEGKGLPAMFLMQNGPHRQGLGGIFIWISAWLTSWDTRADAFAVAGCLIGSASAGLVLLKRLTGRLTAADAIVPLLFLSLSQWTLIVEVPNVSHSALPQLLVMLYLLAFTLCSQLRQVTAATILNFFLVFTGFGLFSGPLTIGWMLWRYSESSWMDEQHCDCRCTVFRSISSSGT